MKELDFDRDIVPLRDRMFRYAQSLLLCAAEAEDGVHDLLASGGTGNGSACGAMSALS